MSKNSLDIKILVVIILVGNIIDCCFILIDVIGVMGKIVDFGLELGFCFCWFRGKNYFGVIFNGDVIYGIGFCGENIYEYLFLVNELEVMLGDLIGVDCYKCYCLFN